jgi:SAM-dependent methyltransferase
MAGNTDYQSVGPIFDAMRTETIGGMSVSEMVGGGNPFPVAVHFMSLLVQYAALSVGDHVLDIGCGCGRLAAALTQHIGPQGSYYGVDIVAGLVDFANRHIASHYPNFRFVTIQKENPAYDGWRNEGKSPISGHLVDVCKPGSIDLCIATSLFTHLDTSMAHETLVAIRRALAPSGRGLISLFLLDKGTRVLIKKGNAALQFEHQYSEGTFIQNPEGPLGAIAFTHEHFVDLLTENELYIEKTLYGNWPGRPHYISGQDIVIIRRMD